MSLALRWKKYNAVITKAVNGQETVDIFEKSEPNSFDAILMDIMMPVMDGIAATKAIILILNQPIDKSSAEISPFFVKLPCRAASPPAVAFLDWSYFICRLCL